MHKTFEFYANILNTFTRASSFIKNYLKNKLQIENLERLSWKEILEFNCPKLFYLNDKEDKG